MRTSAVAPRKRVQGEPTQPPGPLRSVSAPRGGGGEAAAASRAMVTATRHATCASASATRAARLLAGGWRPSEIGRDDTRVGQNAASGGTAARGDCFCA
jgi:hypothetical protein